MLDVMYFVAAGLAVLVVGLIGVLWKLGNDNTRLSNDCLSLETENEELRGKNEDLRRAIRDYDSLNERYQLVCSERDSALASVASLDAYIGKQQDQMRQQESDNADLVKISNEQFAKVQNQQAIIDDLTTENEKLKAASNPLSIKWIGDTGIPEIPDDLPPSVTVIPLPDEARDAMTESLPDSYWRQIGRRLLGK